MGGWLYKLERKIGRFSVPNLMLIIVAGMFAVFAVDFLLAGTGSGYSLARWLYLSRDLVLQGQVWRLITFIFVPMNSSPIWVLFTLYFYYLIGTTLERAWGSFKFNVYYLCGMLGAIIAAAITGFGNNSYLNLSLFFAYAILFPDTEFMLFFILPVKAKYLGFFNAALYVVSLITGTWVMRAALIASLVNVVLFFGGDVIGKFRGRSQYRATRRNFRRYMDGR